MLKTEMFYIDKKVKTNIALIFEENTTFSKYEKCKSLGNYQIV